MIYKILIFVLGFVLFVVAYILFLPLSIINLVVVIIKGGNFGQYFMKTALNLDVFANSEFRTLWNTVMRKRQGYPFGKPGETISSALGKNKMTGDLSRVGVLLCFILDMIDDNHCIKSINWEIK